MKIKSSFARRWVRMEDFTRDDGVVIQVKRNIDHSLELVPCNIVLEGVKIGRAGKKVHFAYSYSNEDIHENGLVEYQDILQTVCGTETFRARTTVAYGEADLKDITCEKCLTKLGYHIKNHRIIE